MADEQQQATVGLDHLSAEPEFQRLLRAAKEFTKQAESPKEKEEKEDMHFKILSVWPMPDRLSKLCDAGSPFIRRQRWQPTTRT